MARTIFVGDIHGCPDELSELLAKVRYAQGVDRLYLVGDLVARGPDSRRAVESAKASGALIVRGNHDEKVLTYWRAKRGGKGKRGGHSITLSERHQRVADALDDGLFAWMDSLPLTVDVPEHEVLVVHAGIDPGRPLSAQDPHTLMNIRGVGADGTPTRKLDGTAWVDLYAGPRHVVFGHDARRGLQLARFATGLDTGCCYGRELTALVLDEREPVPADPVERRRRLVSVRARATYCPVGDGNGPE